MREGVTVKKNSPDLLMVIHLISPDGSRDQLYMSNYATLQIKDVLARLEGVGDVVIFGARDYAMRIWVNPTKIAARRLTAGDIVAAIRAQNVQVASGVLDQPPMANQGDLQLNVQTLGRLIEPRQFANIVIKTDSNGRVTRLGDVGPGRARGPGLRRQRLSGQRHGGAAGDLPAAGHQCARHRPSPRSDHGRAVEILSRRAWNTGSSTTRPSSSPNR